MAKNINEEIIKFLQYWGADQMESFLVDLIPLFEMFDTENKEEWSEPLDMQEDEVNIKIVRAIYLISKVAEKHAGKLATIKCNHRNLYKRLEVLAEQV